MSNLKNMNVGMSFMIPFAECTIQAYIVYFYNYNLYGMHPVVCQYHMLSFISVKHNNTPIRGGTETTGAEQQNRRDMTLHLI
jgi:hypothetical protein